MLPFLTVVVVLAVVVAAIVYAQRVSREARSGLPPKRQRIEDAPEPHVASSTDRTTVTLPISPADPTSATVERLVRQAADQVLHQHPHIQRVEVRDRDGRLLGEVLRPDPSEREVALPEQLSEPQAPRRHAPTPVRAPSVAHPTRSGDDEPPEQPHRTLRQRFDLPEVVTEQLGDEPSLEDVLEAILVAAGHDPQRDEDLLLVGETAVLAVHGSGKEAMNHVYRRYDASPALSGLAITVGFLSPQEVQRRELLAPDLRYLGPDAVQRMADAVALGADPLAFAVGMPLLG